ncbi:MAG: 3-methyl-2-oxobutanoate hydroxymethyltransferase [Alphaproteobacteria bacterium]
MSDVLDRTDVPARLRHLTGMRERHPDRPRVKVNLYRGAEVAAVAEAAREVARERGHESIDCLMVADSYLMTHLGRSSTRLDPAERDWFMDVMCDLTAEVARATAQSFAADTRPFIIGDMPDGAAETPVAALANARRLCAAGADVVKLEVHGEATFAALAEVAAAGVPAIAHLGYVPQSSANRRYGTTVQEALELFALARRARAAGAVGLVLERVTVAVNSRLSAPAATGLPVWSVFSGRCRHAGQSLNVWDSVFRPGFAAIGFPPTAELTRESYPAAYTHDTIRSRFAALLRLTLDGHFPILPAATGEPPLGDVAPWEE